ncbi:MAG: HlyC/CorC family transporter [Ignavibacteria bacterium]|nr:HlyC/CorC family transporter [Ignavibacteria bacterium]
MWEWLLSTALVLFFVLLNGFFVAAEFAIVKVRSTQIEPLAAKGNWRAKVAKDVITHLDAYLSATQLGITMASLALGWLGEPLVADQLRPLLEKIGIDNPKLVSGISFGVGFAIITFLHIILGELAPKSLAIQKASGTTLWTAYPLKVFFTVFKPIIWTLNSLANAILRVIGIQPAGESELMHSEEELRLLLAQEKGVSVASRQIVLNAMDFRRKQARHCMVPRTEMVTLSLSGPAQDSVELMRSNKYSRYPVYKDSIDNIIGIVYTKDIFKQDRHLKPDFSLVSVLRDATFLPETVSLERVLETMLQRKTHMIILADEYGGTAGLITLENVLEELVGPIQDEFDREPPEITKVDEGEYLLDASVTTNEVERLMSQELSPKDILSIGGFLLEQLGHIPERGEQIQVNSLEFTVEQVSDRTIDRVRVKRLSADQQSEEPENP